jgi:hypothetical protein
MTAVRIAAAALVAFVSGVAALEIRSETAARIRAGRPLTGLVSLRHRGQKKVTPPTLYFAALGTASGTLDLVRIPPDTAVFERGSDGKTADLRTLADAYGAAYGAEERLDRAEATFGEAALSMLQSDTAWPEEDTGAPDGSGPAPLDFHLSLSVPSGARPAFPREMRRLVSAELDNRLYWPRFAARAGRFSERERVGRTPYDLLLLAREFRRVKPDGLRLSEFTDPKLSHRLLSRVFARASGHEGPRGPVDVEVLNGSGIDGLALKATRILRLRGFDVVHFGNAPGPDRKSSRFLDRTGNPDGAGDVADTLDCEAPEVVTALEERPRAAVTVVLGKDFSSCRALAAETRSP